MGTKPVIAAYEPKSVADVSVSGAVGRETVILPGDVEQKRQVQEERRRLRDGGQQSLLHVDHQERGVRAGQSAGGHGSPEG